MFSGMKLPIILHTENKIHTPRKIPQTMHLRGVATANTGTMAIPAATNTVRSIQWPQSVPSRLH